MVGILNLVGEDGQGGGLASANSAATDAGGHRRCARSTSPSRPGPISCFSASVSAAALADKLCLAGTQVHTLYSQVWRDVASVVWGQVKCSLVWYMRILRAVPCLAVPFRAVSCRAMPCGVLSCRVVSCHAKPRLPKRCARKEQY